MRESYIAELPKGPPIRDSAAPGRSLRFGLDHVAVLGISVAPLAMGLVFGSGGTAFYAGFACAVVLMALALIRLRSQPVLLFSAVFIWLTVERFAIAAIASGLTTDTLRLLLAYKELFFPLLLLVLLPGARGAWANAPTSVRLLDILAVSFGVAIVVSFVLSDAPAMDRIVNGRRLAVLPLVYLVARLLPWDRASLRSLLSVVVCGALLVAALGLLERSVLEQTVWSNGVPAAFFYHLSSEGGLSATGTDFPVLGLPVVFFDFTAGEPHRRLVSTFLEATTAASFLALGAILALARRPLQIRWLIVAGTIGIATVLTLSKAGWAILALGVGYVLAVTFVRRVRAPAWLVSLAAALLGALIVIAITLESTGVAAGPLAHFEGLKEGIESAFVAPLGVGLGYGGNFGAGKLGAESTFGVTLVQLGWLGLLLWASWLLGTAIVTTRLASRLDDLQLVALAAAGAMAAFLATAALTESSGGLLGNWLYAFVIGAIITVAGTAALRHERRLGAAAEDSVAAAEVGGASHEAEGDQRRSDGWRGRPKWEWAILFGVPIVGNLVLAAGLAISVPRVDADEPEVPPVWSPAKIDELPRLPEPNLATILSGVNARTGETYQCTGPWATEDGLRNWACRTPDSVAVLRGPTPDVIDRIDVTWFGFDTTATDLPHWAAVAAGQSEDADQAAEWVRSNVGSRGSHGARGLDLSTGGGRGAYTLSIDGQAPPPTAIAP